MKLARDRRILEDIGIKKWHIPSMSRGSGRHRNPPGEKLKAQPRRTAGDFSLSSFWDLTIQFQVLSTPMSLWETKFDIVKWLLNGDIPQFLWLHCVAPSCSNQLQETRNSPGLKVPEKMPTRREQYIKIPNKSHLNPMINGIIYQ